MSRNSSMFRMGSLAVGALVLTSACKKEEPGKPADKPVSGEVAPTPAKLSGTVKVDGSSTVFPISEAVAEEFGKVHSGVRAPVGISGTGGGFKKFCAGEIDIADASRPIKESEIELCKAAGIEYIELPVAYDGIAIVVNKANSWVTSMTVAELKKMWEPEAQAKVMKWKDVNPAWPDKPLRLFGAGVDSGTYDYFTEAVNGKSHASRGDYTSSEDDNAIVTGVTGDASSLGFFGFAYYEENQDKLKIVPIDDGKPETGEGAIAPSRDTIENGTYAPLSRPLFIYINKKSLERPEVAGFVDFFMANAGKLSAEVGYIKLPEKAYDMVKERLAKKVVGTVFKPGVSTVGVTIEQLLASEAAAPAPAAPAPAEPAPAATK